MIRTILTKKVITSVAYALIGSETVKAAMTKDNARKVMSATRKAAAATSRTVRGKASNLKEAVNQRKLEILTAESSANTEVPEERTEEDAPDDVAF